MIAGVAGTAGVVSFNARKGVVSLTTGDVTTVLPGASMAPPMDGVAAPGVGTAWARSDHVHPTDTSRYAANNPSGFVTASAAAAAAPVQSVATRIGAVTLTHADITDWNTVPAPYAPLASPVFTGDPQAPTAPWVTAIQSVATTAFVQAAVAPVLHNVGRNLIHNPLFNIAQRGAGPFTVLGVVYG